MKQIWSQRRANMWLFAELLVVFVLLWYVTDFLYGYAYSGMQSEGYEIDHVYHIEIDNSPELTYQMSEEDSIRSYWDEPFEEILRRIKKYPGIEAVSVWMGTDVYTDQDVMFQCYTTDSVHNYGAKIRYVTEEYRKVFNVDMLQGGFTDWNPSMNPISAVLSVDLADSLFHSRDVLGKTFYDYYEPSRRYKVTGIVAPTKMDAYSRYEPFIIVPPRSRSYYIGFVPYISVRVRPENTSGFSDRFVRDMKQQLQVAPFYLLNVESYADSKKIHELADGTQTYISSAYLVISFFFFNVFIGLMGTFWFRTRQRRPEIALRIAMGSTFRGTRNIMYLEGIILLTFAAIPGVFICLNMVLADITMTEVADSSVARFCIGVVITYLLMLVMVLLGILYPSRQCMKIQPAEALHEE